MTRNDSSNASERRRDAPAVLLAPAPRAETAVVRAAANVWQVCNPTVLNAFPAEEASLNMSEFDKICRKTVGQRLSFPNLCCQGDVVC